MAKIKSVTERWEEGIPHHPKSEEMARALAKLDYEQGGDRLCLKFGGDGDNGEHLMYLLDVYFETKEGKKHEI